MDISFKCKSKMQSEEGLYVVLEAAEAKDKGTSHTITSQGSITIKAINKAFFDGFEVGNIYNSAVEVE